MSPSSSTAVRIDAGRVRLDGTLTTPGTKSERPNGLIVFAHGSGSSRRSPRNQFVATYLNDRGFSTLLFDLLTSEEEMLDAHTGELRFDVAMLARRLTSTVKWASRSLAYGKVGLLGASTGAAAALITAAERPDLVRAVVSRGGRPDLAVQALPHVRAPTLLIVGEADPLVLKLNEQAAARMTVHHEIHVVPGATHLFQERGALERVARAAAEWFAVYLGHGAQAADDAGTERHT